MIAAVQETTLTIQPRQKSLTSSDAFKDLPTDRRRGLKIFFVVLNYRVTLIVRQIVS